MEAELQKLSLTMRINLDPTHCSYEVAHMCVCSESVFIPLLCHGSILQLFEHYLAMLSSAGVFQSRIHSTTDMRLGQSVMRVLLAAISHPDKEVGVV